MAGSKTIVEAARQHSDDYQHTSADQNLPATGFSGSSSALSLWDGTYSSMDSDGDSRKAGRFARSPAPGKQPEVAALIEAVAGQKLIIPCGNSTLANQLSSVAITINSSGVNKRQRFRQQQQQQQQMGKTITNGQGISLIVWHKNDRVDSPIFSVDARGTSSLREAKQQTNLDELKGRAHLEESTRVDRRSGLGLMPALVVDEAQTGDSGLYRCTIDFYKAPTQSFQVKVVVIRPPKNMIIRDNQDSKFSAVSNTIGPYDEDFRLELSCEVEPGETQTNLNWWQLKSVTTIPQPQHQKQLVKHRVAATTSGPPELPDQHLITMSLSAGEPSGDDVVRDYFVASQKATSSLSVDYSALTLPFNEISSVNYRLRHWAPVQDQVLNTLNSERISSTIKLSLARSNLGDEFLCLASNKAHTVLVNQTVRIDMNLRPTEVRIINKNNVTMKLNQKQMIECQVFGSKPNARVKWFKGNQELSQPLSVEEQLHRKQPYDNGFTISERDINNPNNFTKISYLTFNPNLDDNLQSLSCSAVNAQMPNLPSISDTMVMNVFCKYYW